MIETDIRRVYGETIFERGMDYFEEERVTSGYTFYGIGTLERQLFIEP